jgi:hypothetical protein
MASASDVRQMLTRRVAKRNAMQALVYCSQSLLLAWRSWHLRNSPLSRAVCPRFRGVPSVDIRLRWNRTRALRHCCPACSVGALADAKQPTRGVARGYDIHRGAVAPLRQNVPVSKPVVRPCGTSASQLNQRGAAQVRTSELGCRRRLWSSRLGGPMSPMCERSGVTALASAWKVASVFGRDRVRSKYTLSFENRLGRSDASEFSHVGLGCQPPSIFIAAGPGALRTGILPEHKLCLV